MCMYCNREIRDEFHFILICENYAESRSKYIPRYYYRNANMIKFEQLMSVTAPQKRKKLCIFKDIIMKSVSAN